MMTLSRTVAILSTAAALTLASLDASAVTIRIRCEKGANRSKVSVDADGLAQGDYKARIKSGGHRRTSALKASTADEVEFDFDSATNETGAVKIKPGFIVGNEVFGKIIDSEGRTVISDIEECRAP